MSEAHTIPDEIQLWKKCIGMCLSKMNILVLFYKLLTTFLPNFRYKYCHLEHLSEKLIILKWSLNFFPELFI